MLVSVFIGELTGQAPTKTHAFATRVNQSGWFKLLTKQKYGRHQAGIQRAQYGQRSGGIAEMQTNTTYEVLIRLELGVVHNPDASFVWRPTTEAHSPVSLTYATRRHGVCQNAWRTDKVFEQKGHTNVYV
jgi:hypothetical protein